MDALFVLTFSKDFPSNLSWAWAWARFLSPTTGRSRGQMWPVHFDVQVGYLDELSSYCPCLYVHNPNPHSIPYRALGLGLELAGLRNKEKKRLYLGVFIMLEICLFQLNLRIQACLSCEMRIYSIKVYPAWKRTVLNVKVKVSTYLPRGKTVSRDKSRKGAL